MTEDELEHGSSGYRDPMEAGPTGGRFQASLARLGALCLDRSIRLAGGLLGSLLCRCVRRKWVYFPFLSEVLSCVPFSFGWKLRHAVYRRVLSACGNDTVLHFGVTLEDERTRIGRNVWVSVGSYIDYAEIGDSVLIGPHAVLLAGGRPHRFERLDISIKDQGNLPKKPLLVGTGAWVGAHATVMAAVGEHAIVGAGAVVTKEVPAYAVVGGNPARLLYMRDANLVALPRRCS
jgi:virginiamycin A acetyltransferase